MILGCPVTTQANTDFHLDRSMLRSPDLLNRSPLFRSFGSYPEPQDEVKELGDQVTSIVPGPKVNVVPVPEVPPLGPSAQSGLSGASGSSGPSGGKAEGMAALPGAVEEEALMAGSPRLGVMGPTFKPME